MVSGHRWGVWIVFVIQVPMYQKNNVLVRYSYWNIFKIMWLFLFLFWFSGCTNATINTNHCHWIGWFSIMCTKSHKMFGSSTLLDIHHLRHERFCGDTIGGVLAVFVVSILKLSFFKLTISALISERTFQKKKKVLIISQNLSVTKRYNHGTWGCQCQLWEL